jgi:hypothetical protein
MIAWHDASSSDMAVQTSPGQIVFARIPIGP